MMGKQRFCAMIDPTINREINKGMKYWQNDRYVKFSKDFQRLSVIYNLYTLLFLLIFMSIVTREIQKSHVIYQNLQSLLSIVNL